MRRLILALLLLAAAVVIPTGVSHADEEEDTLAPQIDVFTPTDGQHFQRGEAVAYDFFCTDNLDPFPYCEVHEGVVIKTPGELLDTAGTGVFTITFLAGDSSGNQNQFDQTYTVDDVLCDGQPADVILALGEEPTTGDDVIVGTDDGEIIDGLGGNDRICAGGGRDVVTGGGGNDRVFGGSGNDLLTGDGGNDRLDGGAGLDRALGDDGNDTLNGQADADRLEGGTGNDAVNGGAASDNCRGQEGTDTQSGCEVRTGFP